MHGSDLSILIIDENRVRAAIIEEGLREAGHAKIAIISEMAGLVRRIEDAAPDVIVIDLENPNRDMLEDLFRVSRAVRKPVAMFVDKSDTQMIAEAIAAGVSAYVVDGLRKDRVKAILDLAIGRFHAFERIRTELETTQFHTDQGPLTVTCSVGVAPFPAAGQSWETLFKATDEALYASKRGGRNRVTVWSPKLQGCAA